MARLIDITGKPLTGEWGSDDDTGKGIPVLRTTNFTNDGIIDFSNVVTRTITKKNLSEKYLRDGDIIIEKSGGSDKQPVGRVVFYEGEDEKYLFNNFTGLLRVRDKERWLPRYVFYSLFAQYRFGGTLPYENRTTGLHNLQTDAYISSVEIVDLPLNQQLKICTILDEVQRVICTRQQQLSALDDLIKARFVEMFGDVKTNPYGFEKRPLKETCTVVTGNTPSRSVSEYYGDSIEWIKTDNIIAGQLNPSHANEYLSDEGAKVGRTVGKGAILMACIAGSVASIGRVCITDREVAFNQQINAVIPKQYDSLYLYVMLQISKEYLVEVINMALKGILSKSKLENKEFIVPPMDEQKRFAMFAAQIDKSKDAIKKSLAETQTLFDSLMQEYFG